mmetsp:Transcript_5462/g.18810  ORF Transcript_5462/g.18810 Transcript_5462/m.18810 type:complete len:505 (-) Transcript_5462:206-1720(-)
MLSSMPTYRHLSKRPGRRSAGSMRSGRFEAPITKSDSPEPCTPSTSASSCETTRSITPPLSAPAPRAGARASSSSKKTTHGLALRARAKTSRTLRSLSPMYMLMSSGPLTERKRSPHSVATAFAKRVLPVPGGPKRRTPERWRSPPEKSSLCLSGSSTVSRMAALTSSRPPISDQRTEGTVGAPIATAVRFAARAEAVRTACELRRRRLEDAEPSAAAFASAAASARKALISRGVAPASESTARSNSFATSSLSASSRSGAAMALRPLSSGGSTASSCVKHPRTSPGMLESSSAAATTIRGPPPPPLLPPPLPFAAAASDESLSNKPCSSPSSSSVVETTAGDCEPLPLCAEEGPARCSESSPASVASTCVKRATPPPRSADACEAPSAAPSEAFEASAPKRRRSSTAGAYSRATAIAAFRAPTAVCSEPAAATSSWQLNGTTFTPSAAAAASAHERFPTPAGPCRITATRNPTDAACGWRAGASSAASLASAADSDGRARTPS